MPTFLFDTDGVLVRSELWSIEYSRRAGLVPDTMRRFFRDTFPECSIGRADLIEVITPYLKEWKWSRSAREYLDAWFEFENQPDTELIEQIQVLRSQGARCYVATNQEKYRLQYIRENMGFEDLFDGIYCSAEMGCRKPEKAFYEYILGDLSVAGSEVVYFDDDERNVESAHELGIVSILYRNILDFSAYSTE